MKISASIGTVEAIDTLPADERASYLASLRAACDGRLGKCGMGICARLKWNQSSESSQPPVLGSGTVQISPRHLQEIQPVQVPKRAPGAPAAALPYPTPRPQPPETAARNGEGGDRKKVKTPFYDPRMPRLLQDPSAEGTAITLKGNDLPGGAIGNGGGESAERAALINRIISDTDTTSGAEAPQAETKVAATDPKASSPVEREPVDADVEVISVPEAAPSAAPVVEAKNAKAGSAPVVSDALKQRPAETSSAAADSGKTTETAARSAPVPEPAAAALDTEGGKEHPIPHAVEKEKGTVGVAKNEGPPAVARGAHDNGVVEPTGRAVDPSAEAVFALPAEEPTPPRRGLDDPTGIFPRPPLESAAETAGAAADREGPSPDETVLAPAHEPPAVVRSVPDAAEEKAELPVPNPVPAAAAKPESIAGASVGQASPPTPAALGSVEDPIAWMKSDLSCDLLLDQMKARYSPLGAFRELPEQKKEELRLVLAEICSPRFAHCGFPSCTRLQDGAESAKSGAAQKGGAGKGKSPGDSAASVKAGGAQKAPAIPAALAAAAEESAAGAKAGGRETSAALRSDSDLQLQARNKLDALVAIDRSDRNKTIRLARAREQKEKIEWRRASVPEEIEALKAIRSQARERTQTDSAEVRAPEPAVRPRITTTTTASSDGASGSDGARSREESRRLARERVERRKAREREREREREAERKGANPDAGGDAGSAGSSGSGAKGGKRAAPVGFSF